MPEPSSGKPKLRYSAGVLVLSEEHPRHHPLSFAGAGADAGVAAGTTGGSRQRRVSRPGIDRRDDLGSPDRFDVYYGMADDRIGVARLDLPEGLPTGALADSPEHKV